MKLEGGRYGKAENLGEPVNSSTNEQCPMIYPYREGPRR
jgi:hypothetical protein